ncbi:MAG TPA: creatininase family protein [Longimicrobiaceae bacterium]|nr:creatininase family protein [Longimicrobiaceae bacterium]
MPSDTPTPPRSYALADLPWTDVAAHLATERRLLIPVGVCDQNGPHLPVAAATTVAEALAADLSREFGVLRAPTFHYGFTARTERDFTGTAGLKPKTLHRALNELVGAWACQGFEEFIAVTAGLQDPHVEALATVRAAGARVRVVEALSVDLSQFMEGRKVPEHAGEVLTSLLLHLRPAVVRMDRARDFPFDEAAGRRTDERIRRLPEGSPGSVGEPTRASADRGRAMYEHILQKVRAKVFISPVPAPTDDSEPEG